MEVRTPCCIKGHARRGPDPGGRWVKRIAWQGVDDHHVTMWLKMGRECPQNFTVARDVDVLVDRNDSLQVLVPSKKAKHYLPRFSGTLLIKRDIGMEMRAGRRIMYGGNAWEALLQLFDHLCFARHPAEIQMLSRIAARHADKHWLAPPQDSLHLEQVVGGAVRRISGEFAERTFLNPSRRIENAFQDDFRVGRYANTMPWGTYDLQRLAEKATCNRTLVFAERQPGGGGNHEEGMRADDHCNRHRPPTVPRHVQEAPEMAARVEAGGKRVGRVVHCPVVAEISGAGLRVFADDDAARHVLYALRRNMLSRV